MAVVEAQKIHNEDVEKGLNALEALPHKAADELRQYVQNTNLEKYKNFLNIMYHYTHGSEEKMKTAARSAHTQELVEYFEYMGKEERGHYIIAREDLKALGSEVSEDPPQAVTDFNRTWDEIGKDGVYGYLGAIYVFENIAKYMQEEGRDLLTRLNLSKTQSRWVAVHLKADLEHGEEIKRMCEKYLHESVEKTLDGAQKAYIAWTKLFITAFS